jgi:hypothetical protein
MILPDVGKKHLLTFEHHVKNSVVESYWYMNRCWGRQEFTTLHPETIEYLVCLKDYLGDTQFEKCFSAPHAVNTSKTNKETKKPTKEVVEKNKGSVIVVPDHDK